MISASDFRPTRGDEETETLEACRRCDLLVIEDLQYLPRGAAETFVQLCDDRLARQMPTVFTSLLAPGRLTRFPARLTSRLAAGLVVGLEPLGPASRLALLEDRASRRHLAVSHDVLAWLATHVIGGGRELQGAMERLEALSKLHKRLPDVTVVAAHFRAEADSSAPTVTRIVERVSGYFQVEPRQLQSRRRYRNALLPRQVGMYLARQLTPLSLQEIGSYFGGRDHSTVLHACRKVERALSHDFVLSGVVRQLHADLA